MKQPEPILACEQCIHCINGECLHPSVPEGLPEGDLVGGVLLSVDDVLQKIPDWCPLPDAVEIDKVTEEQK